MPRLRDIVGYLWVGAIAAPALIVGAGTLYHGYNYHEKRAALTNKRTAQRRKDEKIERSRRKGCSSGQV